MTRPKYFMALLSAASLLPSGCATANQSRTTVDLLVTDVTVYDGADEESFRADVAVDDGRFIAIDRTLDADLPAVRTIDGSGLYLTPGLWDMHVHTRIDPERPMDLTRFLEAGITSVRDVGGIGESLEATQASVDANPAVGPTIYTSYEMLNGESFGPFQQAVTTEAEVRAAIADRATRGADLIKVHRAFVPDLLPLAVETANAAGLPLTGHIPLGMDPLVACQAGMDVEHLGSFLEAYISVHPDTSQGEALAYMLSDESTPLYECLAKEGTVVAPSIIVYPAVARSRSEGDEIPQAFVDFIEGLQQVLARLHESGVTLVSATDAHNIEEFPMEMPPGNSLIDELAMMQDAGLSAREIIPIATTNPARALGVEAEVGSVEAGKAADFLLLSNDPGADINNLRNPVAVYRGGVDVQPASD